METERLLSHAFLEAHPDDAARMLEGVPLPEAAAMLEDADPPVAAGVLQHMESGSGAACLACVTAGRAAQIIAALPLDAAASVLRRTAADAQDRVLGCLPTDVSLPLRRLLQYPDGTVGGLMDPLVLALPDDITVGEGLRRVRDSPQHVRYYLYVVDRNHGLVGVLNLRELLLAPAESVIAAVMRPHVARLSATAERTTAIVHPGWQEFHSLPVVDERGVLVGRMRYETLRQLESTPAIDHPAHGALTTFLVFGELYCMSLSRLLSGLFGLVTPSPTDVESPVEERT